MIVGRSSAKLEQAKSLIGENVKAIATDIMDETAISQAFVEDRTLELTDYSPSGQLAN